MFTQKFKLICSAVGLVAVLMIGLAVPGVTQQPQLLPTLLALQRDGAANKSLYQGRLPSF